MSNLIESIKLTNKNIKVLIPFILLAILFGAILFASGLPMMMQSGGQGTMVAGLLILLLVFFIVAYIVMVGTVGLAVDIAQNEKTSFKVFFQTLKKYFWKFLGMTFLMVLASTILNIAFIGLMELFFSPGAVKVLSDIFQIVVSILFTLAPIILIFDDLGIIAAIKKSVKMAFPAFIRYIIPVLIITIGTTIFGIVLVLIHPMIGGIFVALVISYFSFVLNVLLARIYDSLS